MMSKVMLASKARPAIIKKVSLRTHMSDRVPHEKMKGKISFSYKNLKKFKKFLEVLSFCLTARQIWLTFFIFIQDFSFYILKNELGGYII